MVFEINITTDQEIVKKMLEKMSKELEKEFQVAVNTTTAYGLKELKTRIVKRTGALASSYKHMNVKPLQNVIYSGLRYAPEYETGASPKIINAKPGKMLVFPISQKGKTAKGLLSYTQVRKYFDVVAARKGKKGRQEKTLKEVAEGLGIAFAKSVNFPGYRGRHTISKTVGPMIQKRLNNELLSAVKRAENQ